MLIIILDFWLIQRSISIHNSQQVRPNRFEVCLLTFKLASPARSIMPCSKLLWLHGTPLLINLWLPLKHLDISRTHLQKSFANYRRPRISVKFSIVFSWCGTVQWGCCLAYRGLKVYCYSIGSQYSVHREEIELTVDREKPAHKCTTASEGSGSPLCQLYIYDPRSVLS